MFPVAADSARPLLPNGVLGGSNDPEVVATWFSGEFATARIGIWTGASNIVVADLDRKNSKDGFEALEQAWLELPDTWHYSTPNGGEHWIFAAPAGSQLTGNADYRNLSGLDRRGGNSYVILHTDQVPAERSALTLAPVWLLDEAAPHNAQSFSGTIRTWLDAYGAGEPNDRVAAAIARIKRPDMSHSDMVEDQYNLIRLGAEGSEGVSVALDALREAWLNRDPALHTTPQELWDFKFDEALDSGIAKYGQEVETITALPDYAATLDLLPPDFDISTLMGAATTKAGWFAALGGLTAMYDNDSDVVAVAWGAPALKQWSRDWGIDYVYEQVKIARQKGVEATAPRENPAVPNEGHSGDSFHLLTKSERELLTHYPSFIDRYLAMAETKVNVLNRAYHVQNAWTILSLSFAMVGFTPYESRNVGTNLYQIGLGDSSTGKSESIAIRKGILDQFFCGDRAFDIGSDVSIEAMHEVLLSRDGLPSLFNADEAARVFKQMVEQKYLASLEDALTNYYEGYVPPIHKKSAKEISGKSALTSFHIAMFGTPKRVTDVLTTDMWLSGFLARVVWTIGDDAVDDPNAFNESQSDFHVEDDEVDPAYRSFATELWSVRRLVGYRQPIKATAEALARMTQNRRAMRDAYRGHENWEMLEPSIKRLGDVVRKCSALLAMSRGKKTIDLIDVLTAISYAETWLANVARVAEKITESSFQRDTEAMELYIRSQGGTVPESRLVHRFRNVGTGDPRDYESRIRSLHLQGRVTRHEATNSKGVAWSINANS